MSAGEATPQNSERSNAFRRVAQGRNAVWIAVALACFVAGTVVSVLAAQSVARNGAGKARLAFHLSSAEISSNLNRAIQHEEDLGVSAAGFFAENPKASPAQIDAWANSVHPLRNYPELEKLGLLSLVRAPELPAFAARMGTGFRVVPAKGRAYYCLATAELAKYPSAGVNYCAQSHGLLLLRDSGLSGYLQASAGQNRALAIETPVYSAGAAPSTVAARKLAFVGWVREVLIPGMLLSEALRGHPASALRLQYTAGSSHIEFASGAPRSGAQSSTISLHNGWAVESFGEPLSTGVFANGQALAHLLIGILLSGLIALLVLVVCTGRVWARPVARRRASPSGGEPVEQLYDSLTGLPNRALMLDRAELMLARAGRQSSMLAGALFIDIDGFKDINNKLGPQAGDQLLEIVAERLVGAVRAQDTVGRLGGDEFVVLVESATRGVRLDALARRVIEALHKPVELDEFAASFSLTASIGVAFGRYATPEDLLRDAQLALYSAKAAGKDRYTLFNASMRSVIEGQGLLEVELNAAVAENQFFILYEPIFNIASREVVGLQALLRWQHPTRGVLEPAEFIGLTEETGLIVPIGRWLLEEACTRAAAWHTASHLVGITVRVSDSQLKRGGFPTDVLRALQQSGIEPSLLTIEIPESTIMRDLKTLATRLQEIKQLGVRLAVAGFAGDGYARHAELEPLPLDFLNVNRSTIAASDGEDYRNWLLEAILLLGQEHALGVIAKAVQTQEQIAALQAIGYEMAQGPIMGEPTSAEGVVSLFQAKLPKRARAAAKSLSR
jgi:diguanylate cyclase (GGDEF)-like protein